MDTIIGTIVPYLLKGGLLTAVTYFLGDIRRFVKSAMWQSLIQAAVLGFILFLLDRFLPPAPTVATTEVPQGDQGLLGNQGIQGLLGNQGTQTTGFNPQGFLNNLTNLFQGQGNQNRQLGGDCGCGVKTQVGGECGVTAGVVPVGCF